MKSKMFLGSALLMVAGIVLTAGILQAADKPAQKNVLGDKAYKIDDKTGIILQNDAHKITDIVEPEKDAYKIDVIAQEETHKTGVILKDVAGKVETTVLPDKATKR